VVGKEGLLGSFVPICPCPPAFAEVTLEEALATADSGTARLFFTLEKREVTKVYED